MAVFIAREQWRRQPPNRYAIRRDHPIAQGLVALVDPRFGDLMSGTPMSFSGTAQLTGSTRGQGVTTDDTTGADSGYVVLPSTHPLYAMTNVYSAWIFARQVSSASFGNILSVPYRAGAWSSPFNSLTIYKNSGFSDGVQFQDSNVFYARGAAWSASQQQYVGVRDVSTMRLYIDGRESTLFQSGGTGATDWNTKQPLVLMRNSWESGASPAGMLGTAFLAGIWNRALTPTEIAALNENPWLLALAETSVFYSLPSGGNQTITVSDSGAGSDTITIGAALSIAETGAGTDALSIAAALALADSGTGTDSTPSITVTVTLTDAGTGTETFAGSATIALTDSGAGFDALSILTATLVSIADSATGSDAVAITVSLGLTDTGAGADGIGLTTDTLKAVADVATGTDAVSITVQLAVPDTGAGLEALGITAALAVLDQGIGYDVVVNSAPGLAKIVSITFTARTRRIAFSATARTINFTMH